MGRHLGIVCLLVFVGACATDDGTPRQNPEPEDVEIVSFLATPRAIRQGESTILSWVVENAERVALYGDDGEPLVLSSRREDSVTLSPTRTTVYRLEARNAAGHQREQELEVEVREGVGPEVSFGADRPRIDFESSAKLSWSTENAVRVVITDGAAPILDTSADPSKLSGELEVRPAFTTIYELTATSEDGTDTKAAVEVIVDPVILSFGAAFVKPYPVGAEVPLRWAARGAEALTITSPEGVAFEVPATDRALGQVGLPVGASGRFTLTATRGKGEATSDHQVQLVGTPTIVTLSADPMVISAGGSPVTVTVEWEVEGATSISLETQPAGVPIDLTGRSPAAGWIRLNVSAAATLVFTATNEAGSVSRELVIEEVPLPAIVSFETSATRVAAGEAFTLSWVTTGAIEWELERSFTAIPIPQAAEGSLEQALTSNGAYTLRVRNLAGDVVTKTLGVTVGPPLIHSIAVDAPRYAPGQAVHFEWDVEGATTLQLRDEGGAVVCAKVGRGEIREGGCQAGAPAANGTHVYTLEVANELDERASGTVSLFVSDGPEITSFAATPSAVNAGEAVTFSWAVWSDAAGLPPTLTITDEAGDELEVPGLNDNPNGGTASVALENPGAHTYTLRAATPGTTDSFATVEVEVVALPVITSFTASPTVLTYGEPTTLTWTSEHTRTGAVLEQDGSGRTRVIDSYFDPNTTASGSLVVTPPGLGSFTYIFDVSNWLYLHAFEEVTVEVLPPTLITHFDATPSTVGPGETVTLDWSTTGASVTLAPFVNAPPAELTPSAAFSDISQTGTLVDLDNASCRGGADALDEGCATITFPVGFVFPFDGVERTAVDVYANGFLSFDVGRFASGTSAASNFPSTSHDYVHLAPYWGDLTMATNPGGGVFAGYKNDAAGERLVIQWNRAHDEEDFFPSDLRFQAILWQSGAVDFAYGTTTIGINPNFDAYFGVIGFQDTTGSHSHVLSGRQDNILPGVSQRTWRYFEAPQAGTGTTTVTIDKTTVFTLCANHPSGQQCESRTVVVN